MNAMTDRGTDDYYDVWLDMLARTSRPRFRQMLLKHSGVTLDPELVPYLVQLELRGPTGVLELAALLDQNHPKASRALARLEQLGLIERADDPDDRRVKTAAVTSAGRQVVEAVNQGRRRILDEVFTGWSDEDKAALAALTRRFSDRITALIDQTTDPPPPEPH
jgi:DNA-binding MarR family transcriptional regulator